jgi:putative ABC transport system ATP-binding protein
MSGVEFKDVMKVYGKGEGKQVTVDHVSFTVEKGESAVILRQSGAGK